jgi:ABC-2 type transport system ATP-binding protein
MASFLSVQHLSYGYSARAEVVRDISFDLAPGLTVLLGANGAGKSTLMQLIAGELRPPTGTAVPTRGGNVSAGFRNAMPLIRRNAQWIS